MSEVPPPNLSTDNWPMLRQALVLFGRGVIYALAFWAVYRAMLIVYPPAVSSTESDDKLRQRQVGQLDTYDEQARRTSQMFEESERQQARMRAAITKQEEQAKRFDAILDRWEKQTGVRK